MGARWSQEGQAAYEDEREALLLDFFFHLFLTGVRCSESGRKLLHERGRDFFPPENLGFIFIVFAVLLGRAVLSSVPYI